MQIPTWTLDVEDFGRVKHGSLELSAFNVLVGPNNSGKSYIASLIWYLLSPGHLASTYTLSRLPHDGEYQNLVKNFIVGTKTTIESDDWNTISSLYNEVISENSEEICGDVLGTRNVVYKTSSVRFSSFPNIEVIISKKPYIHQTS
ncbi:MAG TPA: AAA family ATPase, partial [Arenibaculum sp.]|nr:AAA family ATPase [Arenibaculum sp.]